MAIYEKEGGASSRAWAGGTAAVATAGTMAVTGGLPGWIETPVVHASGEILHLVTSRAVEGLHHGEVGLTAGIAVGAFLSYTFIRWMRDDTEPPLATP